MTPVVGNQDVAQALERIAALLEIRGGNAFTSRADRLAAAQTVHLGSQLRDLLAEATEQMASPAPVPQEA